MSTEAGGRLGTLRHDAFSSLAPSPTACSPGKNTGDRFEYGCGSTLVGGGKWSNRSGGRGTLSWAAKTVQEVVDAADVVSAVAQPKEGFWESGRSSVVIGRR